MLLFLVMIALPIISQTFYKIGSDTIVGYSFEQNRKIALILQSEQFLRESNLNLMRMNSTLETRLEIEKQIVVKYEVINNEYKDIIDTQNEKIMLYSNANKQLYKERRKLIVGGVIITGSIVLLMLLK